MVKNHCKNQIKESDYFFQGKIQTKQRGFSRKRNPFKIILKRRLKSKQIGPLPQALSQTDHIQRTYF